MEKKYLEENYVVRIDKHDGNAPETVEGPTTLWGCILFLKGWWGGFTYEEMILVPELSLWSIYIEEVVL